MIFLKAYHLKLKSLHNVQPYTTFCAASWLATYGCTDALECKLHPIPRTFLCYSEIHICFCKCICICDAPIPPDIGKAAWQPLADGTPLGLPPRLKWQTNWHIIYIVACFLPHLLTLTLATQLPSRNFYIDKFLVMLLLSGFLPFVFRCSQGLYE